MSLARIKEKYQVTIPSAIRKQLGLQVGDVLNAEVQDDHILLRPQVVVKKSHALKRFFALLDQVHQQNKDVSDDEVMHDVLEAIKEVRRHKHAHRRR